TLLETLVAISIIGIALVVSTAALQNSLQTSNFVKDQIQAYYLAEDAMEYIVSLRDAGAAGFDAQGSQTTPSWATNLLPCVITDQTSGAGIFCTVDTFNGTFQNFSSGTVLAGTLGVNGVPASANAVKPLGLCTEGGVSVFEQNTNCAATKFTRKVTIQP